MPTQVHPKMAELSKVHVVRRLTQLSIHSDVRSTAARPAAASNPSQRRPASVLGIAWPVFTRFDPTYTTTATAHGPAMRAALFHSRRRRRGAKRSAGGCWGVWGARASQRDR